MLHIDHMLKENELCLVGRVLERGGLHEAGLFVRDSRFLSHFEMKIDGQAAEILNAQMLTPASILITASNLKMVLRDGRHLQSQSIFIEQLVRLDTAIHVSTTVRNYDPEPVAFPLTFEIGADFRDMFDVRGMTPERRPKLRVPAFSGNTLSLCATGSDGREVSTTLTFDPAPDRTQPRDDVSRESYATAEYDIHLGHDERQEIEITVQPQPVGAPLTRIAATSGEFTPRFWVASGSPELDAYISQCDRDLALLQTSFPEGIIPAAGIPWFIAPFGRDSLIVALQTMHAYPKRAASTLRLLASLQGTKVDAWREEEPGKILHEMRYGDMARSGQIPQTPYYGSIDSTPLFVMAFAMHYLWHQNDELFDALIGNVRRALDWIESYGDLDGDGLLEFKGESGDSVHIAQQGWKDSFDSLHFADGRAPKGPIALVEVQGYVYAAYAWLSEAVRRRGETEWADKLAAHAEKVRSLVEESFWMEDAGYYAQALDGQKQRVDAISSNPGHLLFCGLPQPDRAAGVAKRMESPELNCGWGIRTLASDMATYNPLSYHNGSIWPHDSSLAMAGLCKYGYRELAHRLVIGLVNLSHFSPMHRLNELYCGFSVHEEMAPINFPFNDPVNYPVSCSPQAWAAATGVLAVRALLDIRPDAENKTIQVAGSLPAGLGHMRVSGLTAFGKTFMLSLDESGTTITEI